MNDANLTEEQRSEFKTWSGANCSRYLVPPLDMSGIDLESLLLTAWTQNSGSTTDIAGVLAKTKQLGALAEQVEESLAFQKGVYLKDIREKSRATIDDVNAQKKSSLKNVGQTYDATIDALSQKESALLKEHAKAAENYSAQAMTLERLKREAAQRLEQIGGVDNIQRILAINQAVVDEKSTYDPRKTMAPVELSSLKKAESTVYGHVAELAIPATISPIEYEKVSGTPVHYGRRQSIRESVETGTRKTFYEKKRENTFLGKMMKLLNTRIW